MVSACTHTRSQADTRRQTRTTERRCSRITERSRSTKSQHRQHRAIPARTRRTGINGLHRRAITAETFGSHGGRNGRDVHKSSGSSHGRRIRGPVEPSHDGAKTTRRYPHAAGARPPRPGITSRTAASDRTRRQGSRSDPDQATEGGDHYSAVLRHQRSQARGPARRASPASTTTKDDHPETSSPGHRRDLGESVRGHHGSYRR